MDRDEAAMLLFVLVGGAVLLVVGMLLPRGAGADERTAWRRVWLPALPVFLVFAFLFGFAIAELDTLARHGLPVIGLVGNDASWAQIARDQVEILGDDVGTVLAPTDYHRVAQGFSIPGGRRVVGLDLPDDASIESVLDQAKKEAAAGSPVIVNVRLAASDFRKGSLSM